MKPRVFLVALFAAIVLIPSAAASQGLLVGFVANVLRRYPSIRDVAVWTEPNSSKFWQPRKGSAAAYEALLATCWDTLHKAFDGTGQAVPGNKGVSVWYLEDGFQSTPPAGGFVYTGIESDKQPVSEDVQATQLAAAVELAYCQPAVGGFFNFELRGSPRCRR